MEREKLDEFCTPGEGADDMYEYALRVRRTIAEVLDEFKAVRVPVEWACEVLPFMRERSFSIASSPEVGFFLSLLPHSSKAHASSLGRRNPTRSN